VPRELCNRQLPASEAHVPLDWQIGGAMRYSIALYVAGNDGFAAVILLVILFYLYLFVLVTCS
jgi:hypothetical protein